MQWMPVAGAPFDRDLELAVADTAGTTLFPLVFPCRRIDDGWINALTKRRVELEPTHWREWTEASHRFDT
jgi:hypothetical protein